MRTLHVVTGVETVPVTDDNGQPIVGVDGIPATETDEVVDEFKGDQVSFVTEPSGVLVMFRRPNDLWAAYAPGSWKVVRDASGQD